MSSKLRTVHQRDHEERKKLGSHKLSVFAVHLSIKGLIFGMYQQSKWPISI